MIFRQFAHEASGAFSYLLGCRRTRQAVLVDPVAEQIPAYLRALDREGLSLAYVLETHARAFPERGAVQLRRMTGAPCVAPADASLRTTDLRVGHGDELDVGDLRVNVLGSPGQPAEEVAYRVDDWVFAGRALELRRAGQARARVLGRRVRDTLLALPAHTLVLPATSARGECVSIIGLESTRPGRERPLRPTPVATSA